MRAKNDNFKRDLKSPTALYLPLVSIIVLNYNGRAYIKQCLNSICKQSYGRIEPILVDNDSSDDSVRFVQANYSNVKVILNSHNLGFAEGNNVGIRSSSGEYIVLMNNDLFLDPRAIEELLLNFSENTGILGGVICYWDSPGIINSYGGFVNCLTGIHWLNYQGEYRKQLPDRMEVDFVSGALLMIRKSVLEKVGLLGPYYFLYGDDVDLAFKVRRLGLKVEVVSSAVSYHKMSQSAKALDQQKHLQSYFLMNRNMFFFYITQLPLVLCLTSVLSQLFFTVFELTLFKRERNYGLAKIRALADCLRNFEMLWKTRKRVNSLGKLRVRIALKDLIRLFRSRMKSRTYYW